jgi:signal transduction histidine kinase
MPVDYFLFQVNPRWYRVFWALMLSFNLYVASVYLLMVFLPGTVPHLMTTGINGTSMIVACFNLTYLLVGYWFIAKRGVAFATLLGSLFTSFTVLNGLIHSDPHPAGYIYVGMWILVTFMTGAYGLPLLFGSLILAFVYVMMRTNFLNLELSTVSSVLIAGKSIAAVCAHYFWRSRFGNIENRKVSQLSGMLKSNQQQAEILAQSLADGIIITNIEGKITLMNPAAATMTEWPVEEATNIDVQAVMKLKQENGQEIDPYQYPFTVVLREKTTQNVTLQLTGRNNKQTMVSAAVSPVILPGSQEVTGAVAVIRDVSVSHREEKARADFVSTASHEMRTPVAAIEGYLALAMNDKVSKIDPKARSFLEKAHESTQHLGKLFQDLLTSAKAEDGRLVSHPVVVEMGAYVEQLADGMRFAAQKKGLLCDFVIGRSTGEATGVAGGAVLRPLYYVQVDPDRMREVVTNLFDNAVKYTPSGKVSLGLTGNNDVVQIYVRDTGPGIPAEDIPHLFQKFYRVDNSATRTIGGTGLGLFISRKIVELYKGKIWAESQQGKGSTFYINLPRLSTQRASELQALEAQNQSAAPVTSLTTPV